jgi:hypothetical protein
MSSVVYESDDDDATVSNETWHRGAGTPNDVGAAANPDGDHPYTSQCVCPTVVSQWSAMTTRSGRLSPVMSNVEYVIDVAVASWSKET